MKNSQITKTYKALSQGRHLLSEVFFQVFYSSPCQIYFMQPMKVLSPRLLVYFILFCDLFCFFSYSYSIKQTQKFFIQLILLLFFPRIYCT
jgi:hypothetical protein